MQSHFLLLVIFAFFVSLVFAVIAKDEPADQLRFGGMMFGGFLVSAVVLGWLMYPFPPVAMAFENLLLERDGATAIVTINRPKVLNALNTHDARRAAPRDPRPEAGRRVRVVVITGAGEKSFVAGADINELAVQTPTSGREHALAGQHVLDLIENMGKPVIAAINGYALGGGCELAMACTLRLAADTAKLGQPEIALGLIPGYAGTQRLSRLVGRGKAMEMILTGAPITADEAQRIGLVNRVVPAANLMAEARAARRAAGGARADRDALHHQRGEQRRRDSVRRGLPVRSDAVRPGGVYRRHERGDRGLSAEAQGHVLGQVGAGRAGR